MFPFSVEIEQTWIHMFLPAVRACSAFTYMTARKSDALRQKWKPASTSLSLSPLSFASRRQQRSLSHAPVQSQGAWLGPTALKSSTSHIRKQQLNMSHVIYMWGEALRAEHMQREWEREGGRKKPYTRWYAHKTNRREVRLEGRGGGLKKTISLSGWTVNQSHGCHCLNK